MSTTATCGFVAGMPDSAARRSGFAAHGEVRLLIDQVGEPFAYQGVIVHEEHPGPFVRAHGFRTSQTTVVPPEGSGRISNVPHHHGAVGHDAQPHSLSALARVRDATPSSRTVSRTRLGAPSRRTTMCGRVHA